MPVNMTTQSIAVGDNWVKVGNDYVGDQPNGATSGGTAALAWSAPSGLADGEAITITTDGTFNFGTKTQAAPIFYDLGDDVYENGVLNSSHASLLDGDSIPDDPANTIYDQLTNTLQVKRSGLRRPDATMHYQATTSTAWVGKPKAFKSIGSSYGGYDRLPQVDRLYANWYFKPKYHVNGYGEVNVTNVVGTFATKNDLFAEDLIVSNAGGAGVHYMKLIDVVNGGTRIAFEGSRSAGEPNGLGSAELTGASITGATSGATADLDPAGYILAFGGSSKFIRVWDNQAGDSGNGPEPDIGARISWTNGQLTTGGSVSNVNTALIPDEWNQMEVLVDLSTMNVKRWVNNQLLEDYTVTGVTRSPYSDVDNEGSPVLSLLGRDGKQDYHLPEFGDIYYDTTPQRVMTGDAATYSACTKFEVLLPTAWSPSSITATYKTGQNYLYVVDSNGAVINETGVSL